MTIKTRVTLYIVGAGLISSLLFLAVVTYELIEQPFDILDAALEGEAFEAARIVSKQRIGSDQDLLDTISRAMEGYWIEIYDPDARTMVFRSAMAKAMHFPPVAPGSAAIVGGIVPEERAGPVPAVRREAAFRVRTFAFEMNGRSYVVQIARNMEKLKEELLELAYGVLAGVLVSTLALVAISRFLAGRILHPIGRMNDLAREIGERNLDRRLPVGEGRDEIGELARTINRGLDRLQHSFEKQRDFLFDTSHELKTPLTTMRLTVDKIFQSVGEISSSPLKDDLLRLNEQVLRMERLVKDLLNLSSLETMTGIDTQPVELCGLLSSLAGDYGFMADANDIALEVRLPDRLVVLGDRDKLRRAFSNLIDNAIRYNVGGGRILLTADRSAAASRVTVSNTGPGVAESEITKVFDQFYRAEKSRAVQHGGSGLGLTIVKRIVELHGGEVTFESGQDGWTQVTVTLPRPVDQG